MSVTLDLTTLAALLAWTAFAFWLGRRSADRSDRDLSAPPPALGMAPRPATAATSPVTTTGAATTTGTVATTVRHDPADLPADVLATIRHELARGHKIVAIKIMRDATGMGLKEAKDTVEAMER